jgi:hypothetical protein
VGRNRRGRTEEAETKLREDSFREISSGVREFFGHVGYSIWSADCECSIQHASEESHAARPARVVLEVGPHERGGGVFLRHSRQHDNRDEPPRQHDEQPKMLQVGEVAIEEDGCSDTQPYDDQQSNEDVPLLDHVEGVVEEVHLHAEFGHDVGD